MSVENQVLDEINWLIFHQRSLCVGIEENPKPLKCQPLTCYQLTSSKVLFYDAADVQSRVKALQLGRFEQILDPAVVGQFCWGLHGSFSGTETYGAPLTIKRPPTLSPSRKTVDSASSRVIEKHEEGFFAEEPPLEVVVMPGSFTWTLGPETSKRLLM